MNRLRRARGWVLYYAAALVLVAGMAGPAHAQCYINGDGYGCSYYLSPCPYPCMSAEYVQQWFSPDCEGTDTCRHGDCWIFDFDYGAGGCRYLCYVAEWTRCKYTWDA
jgi:hypothetical protein